MTARAPLLEGALDGFTECHEHDRDQVLHELCDDTNGPWQLCSFAKVSGAFHHALAVALVGFGTSAVGVTGAAGRHGEGVGPTIVMRRTDLRQNDDRAFQYL